MRGGREGREGIAIVGMACRYADAASPAELWENVLARRRAFRRLPEERLRLADYPPDGPDGLYAGEAAVLEGWEFDRVAFRVAGATYRAADVAHWLALDVAARALADAGFPAGQGLPRDSTGVLLGNTLTGETSRANLLRLRWPYVRRTLAAALAEEGWEAGRTEAFLARLEATYKAPFPAPTEETLAGGLSNTIAGRICNHFDLHGGGYTVDGACASSLLAVANACSALAAGDLDLALAGGVDVSLDPFELVGFARNGALARGDMRVYDGRADGFIPGEGCGFVVLAREGDALAQGRRIHAVIRGWGVSSDGHGGISRPEVPGQLLAFRRAYARAGFGIDTVAYFEGHGTGTAVGDATEIRALQAALGEAASAAPAAALGSIKANLGHTKAAAGVAGLLKATMAVGAQLLPPATGCDEPHPELASGRPLRILADAEPWPAGRPLRAGVSAMGFGGINAHLAIEGTATRHRRTLEPRERELLASPQDAELFLLAATGAGSLAARVDTLRQLAPRLSRAELGDLAAELQRRLQPEDRTRAARAAIVAASPAELAARLATLLDSLRKAPGEALVDSRLGIFYGTVRPACRIGLLFPGQGTLAPAGGGALARRFPTLQVYYETVEALEPGENVRDDTDTAFAQPAILAHSLAGLAALDRLGIRATVALGHSLGELTALCWAGACNEEEALRLAAVRGRAMADTGGKEGAVGGMAGVEAAAEEVAELLAGTGAVIAAFNGPRRTVISGPLAAVEEAASRARARGLATHRLRVSHAFHSPAMAAAAPALRAAVAEIAWRPLRRPVASTIAGGLLPQEPADAGLPGLLLAQLTSPVRFTAALAAARGLADLWLEVGPGRTLSELAAPLLAVPTPPIIALDAGGPSLAGLLAAAGAAFCLGAPVDTAALFAGRFTRPFDPDRPLRFLANPCESAPLPAELSCVPSVVAEPEPAPAGAPAESLPPLELVRRLVAERAELPAAAVADGSRLLSDLHLNSIAVGQLMAEAARRLGLAPPAAPTDYAAATVAEVAAALAEQPAAGTVEEPRHPAGVDAWVRPFTVELVRRDPPRRRPSTPEPGTWQVIAPPGHPLAAALPAALAAAGGGRRVGIALCLPPAPGDEAVPLLLAAAEAVREAGEGARFAVVQERGGGGGFARTLHLEMPDVATRLIDLPFDLPGAAELVAAEAAVGDGGFAEVHFDAAGSRRVPVVRLLPALPETSAEPAPVFALGPGDVLLATGGGKGIAAECALALGLASGARLALLGRSRPEADAELAANLERMAAAGAAPLYLSADVTDAAAVRAAVARAEAELGPVTAVLHGAGANAPRRLADLDEAAFRRTLAPKVGGLANLLAALDPARLRLLVGFGSILAETGLPGEADYAVANEWLAQAVERFAGGHPRCRCLAVEWSVWAGVGMGERLGRLEALIRDGISPIPLGAGVAALQELLSRPLPRATIVVAGRFGEPTTVEIERPELPLRRFLDRPRVFYPGVELVVDSELSAATDPYLADHVFRGEPLLPAVMGLEAMAQAAMAVLGRRDLPSFEAVELERPVAVPAAGAVTVRVAALARGGGRVDVVLRSSASGFAADHFRAVCRFAPRPLPAAPAEPAADGRPLAGPLPPLDPGRDLYSGLLFQGGRFRRLGGYRRLEATSCLADISPDGATAWFGRYLPVELVLGDPGARDAALHGIQACIPHRTLLPMGVDRLWSGRLAQDAAHSFRARERRREGDTFHYDLDILGPGGELRERWEGLRLRAVAATAPGPAWGAALLAPFAERRLAELIPGSAVRVALEQGDGGARRHRPDGRPESRSDRSDRGAGGSLSVSHAADLTLTVAGPGRLGCDLEAVAPRTPAVWRDLLGGERFRLAELIAHERGEDLDGAATRVWAAAECLQKAGAPHAAPLTVGAGGDSADGWLLLRSGGLAIGTLLAPVRELAGPAALAVLTEDPGAVG